MIKEVVLVFGLIVLLTFGLLIISREIYFWIKPIIMKIKKEKRKNDK